MEVGLPILENTKDGRKFLNFFNVKSKRGKDKTQIVKYGTLSSALNDIVEDELYYSFNTLVFKYDDDGKCSQVVDKTYVHSFEEVVESVYFRPNVFTIDDEDKYLYSDQQYKFLMKIKSYLLAVKRSDIPLGATIDEINDFSINKDATLFKDYPNLSLGNDKLSRLIIEKKAKYFITLKDDFSDNKKNRYLLVDNSGFYLGLIEVVKKREMDIQDITDEYIDYKSLGYRSLKGFKKYLSDCYGNKAIIVVNMVKVIRKFK